MQYKLLLALLFGALVMSALGGSGEGSQSNEDSGCSPDDSGSSSGDCAGDSSSREDAGSFGKSMESDEDNCEGLTDGAEDNDGKCELTDGLDNICDGITDAEQKTIFLNFIATLKLKLTVTVDITIISSMFLEFQAEYPAVWETVAYQNITTTGFVLAKYTKIVTYKQTSFVSSIFTLDDSDNCPLIEAFLNFSMGIDGLESAAQGFCDEELRPFLMNTTLSKRKRVIAIYQLISQFISRSTEYSAFWNMQIFGFGSLRSFEVLSHQYTQTRHVKAAISGSVETCVLITSMETKYQELIAEGKLSIASQFSIVINQCKTEFSSETSFKGRLAIFIRILRAQGRLNWDILSYFYNVYIGSFGSIFDLIMCGQYVLDTDLVQVTATPSFSSTTCSCSCN